jgi:hypothetical protein
MLISKRIRWAGHAARMERLRNAHTNLVGHPEGKIPFERPRRSYI